MYVILHDDKEGVRVMCPHPFFDLGDARIQAARFEDKGMNPTINTLRPITSEETAAYYKARVAGKTLK